MTTTTTSTNTATTKYVVSYYVAEPHYTPVQLPIMIRGQFICESMLSAEGKAIECAKEDAAKIHTGKFVDTIDINDVTPLDAISKPGFYIRWMPAMDAYADGDEERQSHTQRTLGLFYARPKQGWISGEYAGTARPVRYYAISVVQWWCATERAVHEEDDETLNGSDDDDDSTTTTSSYSSDDEDDDDKAFPYSTPSSTSQTAACPCGKETVHFHSQPFRTAAAALGRRRRNRNRHRRQI